MANMFMFFQENQEEADRGECQEVHGEELSRPESDNVAVTDKSETTVDAKMNEETGSKLKKPDKILPCPRCKSMETKFCYYNNYNVNQPRHFCKKCQRYWTAGGTMRNVPVGAGRRKNKNPVSTYNRHVIITSSEAARTDPNGTNLLSFSSDSSLCESMASGLNLVDKSLSKTGNEGLNLTVSLNPSEAEKISAAPKVPCFPGPSTWPYVWNGVSWTILPIYPPPGYWNCTGVSPGTWNSFPFLPQPTGSGPNSPTLGKHSRDENLGETAKSEPERCLWVPKTLRIDDPEEAAKSSIWETLGIKKDEKEETFRAFRSSDKEKSCLYEGKVPGRRPELQVNPAAFSRSENFHESS